MESLNFYKICDWLVFAIIENRFLVIPLAN